LKSNFVHKEGYSEHLYLTNVLELFLLSKLKTAIESYVKNELRILI